MSVRVPLWAGAGKFTFVEAGATKGAMIGRDVLNADGTLFVPDPTPAPGDPPAETSVAWSALIEVPANIQSISSLTGAGFVRRAGASFSASPLVGADLPDVADAGGGLLQKTAFDAKGRKTGSSAATTDDLVEGASNRYSKEGIRRFSFGDASPTTIHTLTRACVGIRAGIVITTPFNGATPTLTLGTPTAPDTFLSAAQNNPAVADGYLREVSIDLPAGTAVVLGITPGFGASQGAGFVVLEPLYPEN